MSGYCLWDQDSAKSDHTDFYRWIVLAYSGNAGHLVYMSLSHTISIRMRMFLQPISAAGVQSSRFAPKLGVGRFPKSEMLFQYGAANDCSKPSVPKGAAEAKAPLSS